MRTRLVALAALLVLGTAPVAGCALSLQNVAGAGPGGEPGYRVTAEFTDVSGLPLGGTVRVGQAAVGRVAAVRTEDFRAVVTLELHADVDLPAGTRARLELTSALGEQFVVLEPPPGPARGPSLAERPVIPLARTARGPDVENTLAAVGTLLNGSGIDQVRTIVEEANAALSGRSGKVRDLLARLDTVLASLDRRGGEIASVIDSMHAVSARLAESTPTIEAALTDIRPALDVLLAERERFATLLADVSALGRVTGGLIERTGTALTTQLKQLRPVLGELASLDADLGRTLADLRTFTGLVRQAAPGDYLLLDGTLDVPLTVAELLDPDPGRAQPAPGGAGALLEGGTR
ncbi:phospholipid/cholesterol/gamma-HCH transport system substrate-binding protein [Prauserella shujinwangii]|uniref:Phospholipid/cholesterol/gamma-HCH transport system substrate-binding protein n=1 Tax=Prauserella shujinwangii TaxID=1453103 RepID=A0A2T0LQ11_9PSEU|nr:MCE family protein [Prauserella shujinwangii]PRX45414.1 phospholipid/cholesterol/gamma-HCH transport system substrate-binding protein [Prauserella shujinwangii]